MKPEIGFTVKVVVLEIPEKVAVSVIRVEALTLPAVKVYVAEVEPCGTVTDEGTLAALELELDNEITAPPLPAGDVRVTVAVADCPLTTVFELSDRPFNEGAGASTVNAAVLVTPEKLAASITEVEEDTLPDVTE
jgi:hypothetical protein